MNCPNCNAEVSSGAKFCGKCGTKLEGLNDQASMPTASQPAQVATGEGGGVDAAAVGGGVDAGTPVFRRDQSAPAQASPYVAPGGYADAGGYAAASGHVSAGESPAFGASPVAAAYPSAPQGCLGAAWHDIASSPGWVKRVLLLMVMNCVPVLNFFAQGYNLQWGAQAARGDAQPLPRGVFGKKTILAGLLFAAINLLGGIAGVVLLAFNIIPFVGFIIVGVANLFIGTFVSLAAMRMMVYRSFGEAFELSELCAKFKKSFGSLFAAACVPGIIAGVLLFLIMALVMAALVLASMAGGSAGYYGYGYGASSFAYDPVGFTFVLLSMFGGAMLFAFVLALFAYGFADLWSMRAVGHWVARNAPEWVEEARDSEGIPS